jgi:hypothetical protein
VFHLIELVGTLPYGEEIIGAWFLLSITVVLGKWLYGVLRSLATRVGRG